MLTSKILHCYNHLVATSVLYLTIVEPLHELMQRSNIHNHDLKSHHSYPTSTLVEAAKSDQDYYEILGVNKDSTKHEIHRAFRQLAKKYHPDKNKDKGAQDEFIKIFKAYETLSDEKKRKEYDERSRNPHDGSFNNWQASNINDFDVHEFFKQYEDQLFRHTQHFDQHEHHHHHNHGQHHHIHQQFVFHGVNLDDLFHDIDEDEFHSFGHMFSDHHQNNHIHSDFDGTFGDGASFFGTHFPSQIHNTLHQYQHLQQAGSLHSSDKESYSCHTVTKQVNGIMMTQTSCG